MALPLNSRFEDFATELLARPDLGAQDLQDPDVLAGLIRAGVMGLAIHDLPLLRTMLPTFGDLEVLSAHFLPPFGYQIVSSVAGRRLELHARMSATWRPEWVLRSGDGSQTARGGTLRLARFREIVRSRKPVTRLNRATLTPAPWFSCRKADTPVSL